MQHYNKWRKRLSEDPYHALFGASNDMLGGKGLEDWEWIGKSFPRWMLREMGMEDGLEKEKDMKNDGHGMWCKILSYDRLIINRGRTWQNAK